MWENIKNRAVHRALLEKGVLLSHIDSLMASYRFVLICSWFCLSINVDHPCLYVWLKWASIQPLTCLSQSDDRSHLGICISFPSVMLLHSVSPTSSNCLVSPLFYPSAGSWVRWRCWLSVLSWWRGWWSPGPSAQREPIRSGYVKTARGRRSWLMTCSPAMNMATSSSRRLENRKKGRWFPYSTHFLFCIFFSQTPVEQPCTIIYPKNSILYYT